MNIRKIAISLLLAGSAWPAAAQTVPQDVRCLLLSNAFGQTGTDDRAKQMARQSLLFYLGRLDGRAEAQAITAAVRSQGPAIDPKNASAEMNGCVARMERTQQMIQTAVRAAAPAPAPKK
jgi:hypothetical protein